jgi:hypothetical protein
VNISLKYMSLEHNEALNKAEKKTGLAVEPDER